MQKKCVNLLLLSALLCGGCSVHKAHVSSGSLQNQTKQSEAITADLESPGSLGAQELTLTGQWLMPTDDTAEFYIDPQPSGLTWYKDILVSISDASADATQIKRLHFIDPETGLTSKSKPYSIASNLTNSCFTQYLQTKPDLEALVKDPSRPNSFITVTEDASKLGRLSPACRARFSATHSTFYPTVLVRLQLFPENSANSTETLAGAKLEVTDVRAVQFPASSEVGNFANDGIEGLAIVEDLLFLGLEKNTKNQARVFSTLLDETFWQTEDFITVQDTAIDYPNYTKTRPNPINGMETFHWQDRDWLISAARNDNELWLVNVNDINDKYKVKLRFFAPNFGASCTETSLMDNASLEGVAVANGILYAVNDPWKKNYHKNIVCEEMRDYYDNAAPLLFKVTLEEVWRAAQQIK